MQEQDVVKEILKDTFGQLLFVYRYGTWFAQRNDSLLRPVIEMPGINSEVVQNFVEKIAEAGGGLPNLDACVSYLAHFGIELQKHLVVYKNVYMSYDKLKVKRSLVWLARHVYRIKYGEYVPVLEVEPSPPPPSPDKWAHVPRPCKLNEGIEAKVNLILGQLTTNRAAAVKIEDDQMREDVADVFRKKAYITRVDGDVLVVFF